jgi:FixJ family two-component response regulator
MDRPPVKSAIQATDSTTVAFFTKPFNDEEFIPAVRDALKQLSKS